MLPLFRAFSVDCVELDLRPWVKVYPTFIGTDNSNIRGCSSPRWGRCFVVATKSLCFCQVKTWSAPLGWTGDGGIFNVASFLKASSYKISTSFLSLVY
jgi:hypothetical protein